MIEEPESYSVKTNDIEMKVSKVPAEASPIPNSVVFDPATAFLAMLRQHSFEMECCTPAAVLKFNRASHIATVLPLCKRRTNLGKSIAPMPINVHVWRYACGGVIIDLPVKTGDTGWLIAGDLDTTYVKDKNASFDPDGNEGSQEPQTNDLHRYRFGLFLPDSFCNFEDISQYGDEPVIGTYDGDGTITPIDLGGDPDPTKCVTSLNEYTGDIVITAGNNVSITKETTSGGEQRIKISSSYHDTTYDGGTGISIDNTTINNDGVLAIVAGNSGPSGLTGTVAMEGSNGVSIETVGNTITIKGDGGGGNGSMPMFEFNPDTRKIASGFVMAGRKVLTVSEYTVSAQGYFYIQVNHPQGSSYNPSASIQRSDSMPNTSNTSITETIIPLMRIQYNATTQKYYVSSDWRYIPGVPLYE